MEKKQEITIVGAGLSGLTAGILLARKNYRVNIIERAKSIGADKLLHPSLHATPIDVKKIINWTNLAPEKMFTLAKSMKLFIGNQNYDLPPVYIIERGNRTSSIDRYLYKEALNTGVKFEFGKIVKKLNEIPHGSILATGFYPEIFKEVKTPCRLAKGYAIKTENFDPDLEKRIFLWTGPYTNDYAYGAILNGILFIMLFSRYGLTDSSLAAFQKHIKKTVGWEFDNWESQDIFMIPCANIKKPRLFADGYILTGTLGSVMDPVALFGIHGAILSGVIAAWAVENPFIAEKQFAKLNKNYALSFLTYEIFKRILFPEILLKSVIAAPELFLPTTNLLSGGIPGYERKWFTDLLRENRQTSSFKKRIEDFNKIFKK